MPVRAVTDISVTAVTGTANLWGPFFAPPALTSFDAIVDFVRGVRRSSFVRSLVFVRSKNLANFNFAKAGARPDGGTARHGRGPSLGKIEI